MEIICSKCGFGVQGAKCSVCGTYAPAQKPAASQQQSSDVNIVKKATSFASSVVANFIVNVFFWSFISTSFSFAVASVFPSIFEQFQSI